MKGEHIYNFKDGNIWVSDQYCNESMQIFQVSYYIVSCNDSWVMLCYYLLFTSVCPSLPILTMLNVASTAVSTVYHVHLLGYFSCFYYILPYHAASIFAFFFCYSKAAIRSRP